MKYIITENISLTEQPTSKWIQTNASLDTDTRLYLLHVENKENAIEFNKHWQQQRPDGAFQHLNKKDSDYYLKLDESGHYILASEAFLEAAYDVNLKNIQEEPTDFKYEIKFNETTNIPQVKKISNIHIMVYDSDNNETLVASSDDENGLEFLKGNSVSDPEIAPEKQKNSISSISSSPNLTKQFHRHSHNTYSKYHGIKSWGRQLNPGYLLKEAYCFNNLNIISEGVDKKILWIAADKDKTFFSAYGVHSFDERERIDLSISRISQGKKIPQIPCSLIEGNQFLLFAKGDFLRKLFGEETRLELKNVSDRLANERKNHARQIVEIYNQNTNLSLSDIEEKIISAIEDLFIQAAEALDSPKRNKKPKSKKRKWEKITADDMSELTKSTIQTTPLIQPHIQANTAPKSNLPADKKTAEEELRFFKDKWDRILTGLEKKLNIQPPPKPAGRFFLSGMDTDINETNSNNQINSNNNIRRK